MKLRKEQERKLQEAVYGKNGTCGTICFNNVKDKTEGICGQVKEIMYDKKIDKLNLQLAIDGLGCPIIIFEDLTNKKSKELFRLHIKEAIELKSIIDTLAFAYLETKMETETKNENYY